MVRGASKIKKVIVEAVSSYGTVPGPEKLLAGIEGERRDLIRYAWYARRRKGHAT